MFGDMLGMIEKKQFKLIETTCISDLAVVLSWVENIKTAYQWGGCNLSFPLKLDETANDIGFFEHQNYVFTLDQSIIGFVQLKKITNYHHNISKIIICPAKRGCGYFKCLLKLVIEVAKAQGAGFIGLHVKDDNDLALKYYSKFGFEQYAFEPPNTLKMRLRM